MSQKYRRVNSSNTASLKMLNRTTGRHKKERENEKYEDEIYKERVKLRKLYRQVQQKDFKIEDIEDNIIKNYKLIEVINNNENMKKIMSLRNPSFGYINSKSRDKLLKIKNENSALEDKKVILLTEMNNTLTLIRNVESQIKKLNNKITISNLSLGGKKRSKYTKKNNGKRTRKKH